MSDRNAAGKVGTADGGLVTGGSADGGAIGDAGVGAEAEGGEAKADRSPPNQLWGEGFRDAVLR
jgi:hypothetical protein